MTLGFVLQKVTEHLLLLSSFSWRNADRNGQIPLLAASEQEEPWESIILYSVASQMVG